MSTMTAVRLDDELLAAIDRERRRAGLSRARVIREAMLLWLERRRTEEAIKHDQQGYARRPVRPGEFDTVLGAQVWPK